MRVPIRNSSVLVTGGAGFIGSHLVDALLAGGAREVVVMDNLFLGEPANLAEAMENGAVLYRDDCEFASSLEYVFNRHDIDVVFNCATKALNHSFLNPSNSFSTNVNVILNLLELQRRSAFKSLVHFSTSEVYGTAVQEPMDETHPRNPTTAYAGGKLAADVAVETWVRMFGLDAIILRPFNNYGPRQNCRGQLAGVIPVTVARILGGQQPVIHGDGTQKRDFIHVHDTVACTMGLYKVTPAGESVNVATGFSIDMNTLIAMICSQMGYDGGIIRQPSRSSDVACHAASNVRLNELLAYEFIPFKQGLKQTVEWYERHLSSGNG
jgi:UDP-glucose 4-epimerase